MKKLVLFFVLILCSSCVKAQTCWGTNEIAGSATTITVSVSPTGGTGHVLYGLARNGNNGPTITFSDPSNSWTSLGSRIHSGIGDSQSAYSANIVGGTYTVTVTFGSSAAFRAVAVCEFSGFASASVLDTQLSNACSAGSSCTTSAFTTTQAGKIIILINSNILSTSTIAGSSGIALTTNCNDITGAYISSPSAQTAVTASATGINNNGVPIFVAAFKNSTASLHAPPGMIR